MKLKKPSYFAALGLAICLTHQASAWPDFRWTDASGDGMWSNGLNWTNLDNNTTGVPEGASNLGAVQVDPVGSSSFVTIPSGYVVDLDYENPTAYYNTIFGPEWGFTFNIYGTLEYAWMMAPVQNDPTPGRRSIINLYAGSTLATAGAGLGIGDAWWWYQAAPYVTLNMYGNAQLNVPNLALGGHANVYDTATVNISANVFTGNPLVGGTGTGSSVACSDGTASLVLGGGTLKLPTGYTNEATQAGNTIYDLVARGVLRAYGKGFDTNDLVVSDDGTNTTVTPVPLGGALQRVYFQPLLRSNVTVGMFQQAVLVGDYPSVSGVLLGSAEPGLDPASFPHPVYTSSNPGVVTVDTNGLITAVGQGKATVTATVGAFNTTNSVAITVSPAAPDLVHRYSFKDTAGSLSAADSIGGAAWAGTLNGDAALSGSNLVLSGNTGSSVTLPAGIVSNLDEMTIEVWATFPSAINASAYLFAFGNTDTGAFDTYVGDGENYVSFSPHGGGLTSQANFGQGDPGNAGERDAVINSVLDSQTNVQIVAVFHPLAGYEAFYSNGVLAASTSMLNDMIDPVAKMAPTFNNGSVLNYTLGTDPLNYIGQSLYVNDPGLLANVSEFRIYRNALTPAQIAADHALGPNQLIGTSTNVTLSASVSGGNLVIKWPTTSALVALMSSPTLGSGAVWTPVSGSLVTDGSGNYQINVPASDAARFFRVQQ